MKQLNLPRKTPRLREKLATEEPAELQAEQPAEPAAEETSELAAEETTAAEEATQTEDLKEGVPVEVNGDENVEENEKSRVLPV